MNNTTATYPLEKRINLVRARFTVPLPSEPRPLCTRPSSSFNRQMMSILQVCSSTSNYTSCE